MKKNITLNILSVFMLICIFGMGLKVVNAESYTFPNDLYVGASGQDVSNMQTQLINLGFDISSISSGATSKGYFGQQTKDALIRYQTANSIPATGFFGPLTRGRWNGGGINNPATFRVVSPNGGESWQTGTVHNITWTSPYYFRATYADIKLVPSNTCTGQVCSMLYRMPYVIATNVPINQNSYSWSVGTVIPQLAELYRENSPIYNGSSNSSISPDGQYTIQICETGTNNCDSSNNYFNIYSNGSVINQPVINGINAPTTLSVNQSGTWTVSVTDPQKSTLNYSVTWGDENNYVPTSGVMMSPQTSQSATFTHSYSAAGFYTVRFSVRNSTGGMAQTSATVNVTGSGGSIGALITVLSPNGGEVWNVGDSRIISWSDNIIGGYYNNSNNYGKTFDIYLTSQGCTYPSACMIQPQPLAKSVSGNSYTWTVGSSMSNTGITGSYKITVCQTGAASAMSTCGTTNTPFTINSSSYSSTPDINIVSPNGGETWQAGTIQTVRVNVTGDPGKIGNAVGLVLVDPSGIITNGLSIGGGTISSDPGIKAFQVAVPASNYSGPYKIYASLNYNRTVGLCPYGATGCALSPQLQAYDYSDNYFTISNNYYNSYGYSTSSTCPQGYICTRNTQ